MKKNSSWRACASVIAFLAAVPAHAIVILSGDYVVGGTYGDTGVSSGDNIHISGFYDPEYAQFISQDQSTALHWFAAEHAGLTFTVGDLVWRTTGPLTLQTWYDVDNLGRPKSVSISLLGYTRVQQDGVVTTTLETPWSPTVVGNEWMHYGQRFNARDGLDPADVLGPRLYTESDIASLLMPSITDTVGATIADTTTGTRSFNILDPNYVPRPVTRVSEPSMLALFGIGLLGIAVSRRRSVSLAR
jgi:hypothetical protein